MSFLDELRQRFELLNRKQQYELSRRQDMARDSISSNAQITRGRANQADAARQRLLRDRLEANITAQGGLSGNPQMFSTKPINLGVQRLQAEKAKRDAVSQIGTPLSQGPVRSPNNPNLNRQPAGPDWGALATKAIQGGASAGGAISNPLDSQMSDLEKQIQALLSKPDIPGQWISPYSQEYLNGLGDRLTEQGSIGQQQFEAAKQDVINNYLQGNQVRDTANAGFFGQLSDNLKNLGMDYGATQQGQQAQADAAYLAQMTGANQANDTSFMDKLGELAAMTGSNLGTQAREGLLTPKQWVGPQSGLSAGEAKMVDFLEQQYFSALDQKQFDKEASLASRLSSDALKLTQTADEDFKQLFPEVVQGMASVGDPRIRDEIDRVWSLTGDPAEALKYVVENYSPEEGPRPPSGRPSSNPEAMAAYQRMLNQYNKEKATFDTQAQMYPALLDFFKRYSPTYTGSLTSRSLGNSSRATTP